MAHANRLDAREIPHEQRIDKIFERLRALKPREELERRLVVDGWQDLGAIQDADDLERTARALGLREGRRDLGGGGARAAPVERSLAAATSLTDCHVKGR